MATTPTAPTIATFSGLASGIDTNGIISKLQAFAQRPITQLTTESKGLNDQLTAYQTFNTMVAALESASNTLTLPGTFTANSASSSVASVATISASAGALAGSHSLTVNTLASAQQIVSSVQTSNNLGLNLTGNFTINGRSIAVATSDSLSSLVSKINAASAGVTASVVTTGVNQYQLSLTSNKTGTAQAISAVDTTGMVLGSLGIINSNAPSAFRQPIGTNTVGSLTATSATQALGSVWGYSTGTAPTSTVTVGNGWTGAGNSASISIDLNSDSLSSIAGKINGAGISGIKAQIVSLPDANGNTGGGGYQLQITNSVSGRSEILDAQVPGEALDDQGAASPNVQTVMWNTDPANSNRQWQINSVGGGKYTIIDSRTGYALADPGGSTTSGTRTDTETLVNGNTSQQWYINSTSGGMKSIVNVASGLALTTDPNAADNSWTWVDPVNTSLPNQQWNINPTPIFTDGGNVLSTLGILQKATVSGNQPVAAQDANFTYDGLNYTRASNTVGDLISGASVSLLQQTPSGTNPTPASTTLNISQNTASVVSNIQNFATAYNNVVDFINTQNKFTPPTGDNTGTQIATAPLFGSQVLTDVQQQIGRALGVSSGKTTLGSIGVTVDATTGHLVISSSTLTNALQANSSSVQSLFGVIGQATDTNVQFVGSSPQTKQSSGAGFAVNVTTPATQSTATATVAQSGASTAAETLSFSGLNFSTPISITLNAGNTLQDTVNQINGDSLLSGLVSASIVSGKLQISSIAYGSTTGFSVSSNLAAASTNSGIGGVPTFVTGTDVAGTINGEAATGHGQTLSGKSGNKHTGGLILKVTATSAGTYGSVSVKQGIGTTLFGMITNILDPASGQIANAESALNTEISNNEKEIARIQDQVTTQVQFLQTTFSAMETHISQLQSQGQAFSVQAQGIAPWTTSTSGH